MQAHELIHAFIQPMEKAGLPYFVTGSVASIIYGDPRLTHDIDVVVHLTAHDVHKLIQLFPDEDYYCPPEEVIRIELNRKGFAHFNLIHHKTGLKADIYPDDTDALYAWAFNNKRRIEIIPQLKIWVAPPEYVIIRKLEYFREGGSQKHLDDIRKILAVSSDTLDHGFLREQFEQRELTRIWNLCQ